MLGLLVIAAFAALPDYRAFGFEYAELLQKMLDLVQALLDVASAQIGRATQFVIEAHSNVSCRRLIVIISTQSIEAQKRLGLTTLGPIVRTADFAL